MKHKLSTLSLIAVGVLSNTSIISASILNNTNNVYAGDNLSFEVTIGPSLGMSVSSNVVSLDLDPVANTYNTSRLNVLVGTNNSTGYTLSVTSSSTDLTRTSSIVDGNGNTTTPIISTLPHLVGGYSESDFINNDNTINHWGYRLNSSTGNYYPFSTTLTLNSSTTPINNDPTTLDFIARIDSTKPAGTYELALNFTSVTNYVPTPIIDGMYMQDVTAKMVNDTDSLVAYTIKDKRDENDYTVKKINGQLWMTQNLRFMGTSTDSTGTMTLKADTTNVASDTTINYSDLTSGNDYSDARLHVSANATYATDYGVYYNYAATTAGTITGNSNDTAAQYDICPYGWHLPSAPNTTANTDFNKLVGNTTSGWQAATAGLTAFGAVAAGSYWSGLFGDETSHGAWWSTTAITVTNRYRLNYDSGNGQFNGNSGNNRASGLSIRCVFAS